MCSIKNLEAMESNHNAATAGGTIRSLALITSQAFSIANFRGELVEAWCKQGIRVYAVAPDFNRETRAAVVALGAEPVDFRLARTGLNPLVDLMQTIALARILKRLCVDACFCYFIKPVIYGSWAARLAGVDSRFAMIEGAGYVYSANVRHKLTRTILRKSVSMLYRSALYGAKHVFFLNEEDYRLFVPSLAAPERSSVIGGIGVDLRKFAETTLPAGRVVFILAARLLIEKGVREYVEAARRLQGRARFILLGGPDVNPDSISREEIDGWVANGWVEWTNHVPDVRPLLAHATVFVLPSYYREGVPRSIQEAMAMGRAIITTDMPGCRDTVVHGENGYIVPPKDVDALVSAMTALIDDTDLVVRMGQKSREMAEQRFDVNRVNRLIMARMGICAAESAMQVRD